MEAHLRLVLGLSGQDVTVELTDGSRLSGLLFGHRGLAVLSSTEKAQRVAKEAIQDLTAPFSSPDDSEAALERLHRFRQSAKEASVGKPNAEIVLRYVRVIHAGVKLGGVSASMRRHTGNEGKPPCASSSIPPGATVVIPYQDVVSMTGEIRKTHQLVRHNEEELLTDRQVSAPAMIITETPTSSRNHREPVDERWIDSKSSMEMEKLSLFAGEGKGTGDSLERPKQRIVWNQFDANQELFGVRTSEFPDDRFTKPLDRTSFTPEQVGYVEEVASLIERDHRVRIDEDGRVASADEVEDEQEVLQSSAPNLPSSSQQNVVSNPHFTVIPSTPTQTQSTLETMPSVQSPLSTLSSPQMSHSAAEITAITQAAIAQLVAVQQAALAQTSATGRSTSTEEGDRAVAAVAAVAAAAAQVVAQATQPFSHGATNLFPHEGTPSYSQQNLGTTGVSSQSHTSPTSSSTSPVAPGVAPYLQMPYPVGSVPTSGVTATNPTSSASVGVPIGGIQVGGVQVGGVPVGGVPVGGVPVGGVPSYSTPAGTYNPGGMPYTNLPYGTPLILTPYGLQPMSHTQLPPGYQLTPIGAHGMTSVGGVPTTATDPLMSGGYQMITPQMWPQYVLSPNVSPGPWIQGNPQHIQRPDYYGSMQYPPMMQHPHNVYNQMSSSSARQHTQRGGGNTGWASAPHAPPAPRSENNNLSSTSQHSTTHKDS